MKAAILCPGPSLFDVKLDDLLLYDIRIAVNTAIGRTDLRPTHHIHSDPKCVFDLIGGNRPFDMIQHLREINRRKISFPPNWMNFSMTKAVVSVGIFVGCPIDIFGADLSGSGYMPGDRREIAWKADRRWPQERRILARVTAALLKINVRVKRIKASTIPIPKG